MKDFFKDFFFENLMREAIGYAKDAQVLLFNMRTIFGSLVRIYSGHILKRVDITPDSHGLTFGNQLNAFNLQL